VFVGAWWDGRKPRNVNPTRPQIRPPQLRKPEALPRVTWRGFFPSRFQDFRARALPPAGPGCRRCLTAHGARTVLLTAHDDGLRDAHSARPGDEVPAQIMEPEPLDLRTRRRAPERLAEVLPRCPGCRIGQHVGGADPAREREEPPTGTFVFESPAKRRA